ncbi:hypothetical protein BC829DRAFT_408021 [Chytridium lagenaria]|nr:hypothetical protein BC829DRAFT_408021 [Chytridium lagenaria]
MLEIVIESSRHVHEQRIHKLLESLLMLVDEGIIPSLTVVSGVLDTSTKTSFILPLNHTYLHLTNLIKLSHDFFGNSHDHASFQLVEKLVRSEAVSHAFACRKQMSLTEVRGATCREPVFSVYDEFLRVLLIVMNLFSHDDVPSEYSFSVLSELDSQMMGLSRVTEEFTRNNFMLQDIDQSCCKDIIRILISIDFLHMIYLRESICFKTRDSLAALTRTVDFTLHAETAAQWLFLYIVAQRDLEGNLSLHI